MNRTQPRKPLSECRILVTPTSFGKNDPSLRAALEAVVGEVIANPTGRPLKAGELLSFIRGVDGYIAGLDEIDRAVMEAADRLQVIARYGTGVDRVDVRAATARGIVVANTPGANSAAVAELTIGMILALARNLCPAHLALRQGEWPRFNGVGLRGKTAGLIGLGAVGREVAARLAPFGCRILASDPNLRPEDGRSIHVELTPLTELLAQSDFVSLHAPVLPSTRQMVNPGFLASMKPGAFLINTARGELVDEAALLAALKTGQLRGAALDCFSSEPPPPDHPFLHLPQLLLTPHMGAHTDEAVNQMGWMAWEACRAVLLGERPEHVVNPEVYSPQGF